MTSSLPRSQAGNRLDERSPRAGDPAALHLAPVVESSLFRHVMGHLAAGVTVVTTAHDGEPYGATVSSVTSLSVDPPTVICCLSKEANTGQAVAQSRTFAVNILEEGQTDLAERFALGLPSSDKFVGVALADDPSGQPVLADALAYVVCRVREAIDGGTHFIFVSEVVKAETRPGRPLAYYRGAFGYFALDEDLSVRDRLRNALLAGALESGRPLDLAELTAALDASATGLHFALRELVAEGLVLRDPDVGYLVADPDQHRSDTLRARRVVEAGVLASVATTGGEFPELRETIAQAVTAAEGATPSANELHAAVHAAFVALAGSRSLHQAHHHLSSGVAAARHEPANLQALLDHDLSAVAAAERGDPAGVHRALIAHLELERELEGS